MSVVDEIFEALALLFGAADPRKAIVGQVCDQIGVPIAGATVSLVATGAFSGSELARALTDEQGRFALDGAACPAEYLVVIKARGADRRLVETRRPPFSLDEIRMLLPLALTGTVGDGGDNRPYDLRRVQDRLHRLGRLSDADVSAEPIDLAAPPPLAPPPRLMSALARHFTACFGRPLPSTRAEATGPTGAALGADPPFPPTQLALGSAVGQLPGGDNAIARNAPASFYQVQSRLHQLGLLTRADHVAERTDSSSAVPVDPATKPQTMAAIVAFDHDQTGGSLRAIVPGAANERQLNDPFIFGRRPLHLSESVGVGGTNRASDVSRVQDRLRELGALSDDHYKAERAALGVAGGEVHIADAAIPQTLAAIQAFLQGKLGGPAAASQLVDPVDPALRRLNRPARLELSDTVGWAPAFAAANRPADVRRLQDRLLLLGFLTQAAYDAERADPFAAERVDQADVALTAAALALASEQRALFALTGAVGAGAANVPTDVRAVQDRLRGLRFLDDGDYQRERIDPVNTVSVDETTLGSTFAAIAQVRQRVFELPAGSEPWAAAPLIEPGDETHQLLIDPLFFGRHPLQLSGSVGTQGWNFPLDVRALQERLRAMRLLAREDFEAEKVDPMRPGRVGNLQLSATRQAIRRLREALLAEAEPVLERVELRSAALTTLEDRLGALRVPLELGGSVGWDGNNAPADVLLVQRRLHGLGILADEDFEQERQATPAAGEIRIRDYQIPQTIQAIADWQELMLGAPQEPRVEAFSETLYTLVWPAAPRSVRLELGAAVGRGCANSRRDVRMVQDRLFELGLLAGHDYFVERVDPAVAGAAAEAGLAATIIAIGRLQQTLAGLAARAPDFVISVDGRSQRILEEPAFSTSTVPNPNCAFAAAGPTRPDFADADLMRLIHAIEAVEGGVSQGEIPAILRNASRTAASWGAAQVIGGTAIGTLAMPANAAFAAFYELTAPRLAVLRARATATVNLFNEITNIVVVNTSEAALQAQLQVYVAANSATVRTNTGLGPRDIENMFRAAQLRRHLLALGTGGDEAVLFNVVTHPDAAANISRLGLSRSEVRTYMRNPAFYGEHRQGFVTRSLFLAPLGQVLRNALTDDSGFKLGRYVIRDNWNSTDGLGLTTDQRAQLTAYLHNHGGNPATLAGQMALVAADNYVVRVMARYNAP